MNLEYLLTIHIYGCIYNSYQHTFPSFWPGTFFYLVNFCSVVLLIGLFALSVVAIAFDDFGGRTSITMTLLLTLVAFKFVMTTYVPPTSYLTLLDTYMILAIGVLALIIGENFIVATLPSVASYDEFLVDSIFYSVMAGVWILFHVFIAVGELLYKNVAICLFIIACRCRQYSYDNHHRL